MADQNITQILAALAAQKGDNAGQGPPPMMQQPSGIPGYQQPYPVPTPPNNAGGYSLPQPAAAGNFDLSSLKPASSGSVSLGTDKRGGYDQGRGTPRDGRSFRSRSRSRSPVRGSHRDSYNPYRDERREDARRSNGLRDRSMSPGRRYADPYSSRGGFTSQDYGADANMETIMIDSGLVGLIIGRSGENLRRVENDTNTRVQFMTGPESSGPHRLCKITGPRSAREAAKNEINRIIAENGKSGRVMSADRPPQPKATPVPQSKPGEESTQIMVPDRTVGLIIGRGGETIRDLQERSGCHVNITSEDKSVNGLRPVNLIGNQASAKIAKDLIMEIVDSDNKGLASGGGGGSSSGGGGGGVGVGVGVGHGTGANATSRSANSEEKINDTLIVPSDAVGMIIGKGGETIKDMQTVTGCKINIPQWSGNGPDVERVTGLIGTRAAIEHAKRAIMEKVQAVEDKNRANSGRQQPAQDQYNRSSQPSSNQGGYPSGGYPGQSQAGYPMQEQVDPQANAAAAGGADPYAAYGGYQNYVNMWYAAIGQQQQQQGGAQGPPAGQPGSGPAP